jgi:Activator of Hsp90 ATPase homolog 1-like protein
MNASNFTTAIAVDQTPDEVFAAIINPVNWWTGEIDGSADQVGDEFSYRYGDVHYSKQKVTELDPGKKVTWQVVDSHLSGPDDPNEWTGTEITFDITTNDGHTELRFSHLGLIPDFECFDSCSSAWGFYINGSLRRLITTGEGPTTPPWA